MSSRSGRGGSRTLTMSPVDIKNAKSNFELESFKAEMVRYQPSRIAEVDTDSEIPGPNTYPGIATVCCATLSTSNKPHSQARYAGQMKRMMDNKLYLDKSHTVEVERRRLTDESGPWRNTHRKWRTCAMKCLVRAVLLHYTVVHPYLTARGASEKFSGAAAGEGCRAAGGGRGASRQH
jgi:hypothetical protein